MTLGRNTNPCACRPWNYYSGTMSTVELRLLPRAQKLQLLEDLWVDLSAEGDEYSSPPWHEQELAKTEAEFAAGRIEVLDLETAWNELRQGCK